MRKILLLTMALGGLCLVASAQAQQKATEKDVIGSWSGNWTGGSTGKFELTITKDSEGKLGGTVSPSPDNGQPYTSPLTSVVFADGKLTVKCFDPPGEVEITVETTLENNTIKGKYTVRTRADGAEVETGNVTATKKPAK